MMMPSGIFHFCCLVRFVYPGEREREREREKERKKERKRRVAMPMPTSMSLLLLRRLNQPKPVFFDLNDRLLTNLGWSN